MNPDDDIAVLSESNSRDNSRRDMTFTTGTASEDAITFNNKKVDVINLEQSFPSPMDCENISPEVVDLVSDSESEELSGKGCHKKRRYDPMNLDQTVIMVPESEPDVKLADSRTKPVAVVSPVSRKDQLRSRTPSPELKPYDGKGKRPANPRKPYIIKSSKKTNKNNEVSPKPAPTKSTQEVMPMPRFVAPLFELDDTPGCSYKQAIGSNSTTIDLTAPDMDTTSNDIMVVDESSWKSDNEKPHTAQEADESLARRLQAEFDQKERDERYARQLQAQYESEYNGNYNYNHVEPVYPQPTSRRAYVAAPAQSINRRSKQTVNMGTYGDLTPDEIERIMESNGGDVAIGLSEKVLHSLPVKTAEDEDVSSECTICMDKYHLSDQILTITTCNHQFHYDCISPWFEKRKTCPVCRTEADPAAH